SSEKPVGHCPCYDRCVALQRGMSAGMTGRREMAARSIATGAISFGLVTVPIRIYPATRQAAGISFHLLHAKDGSRVKQQYVCAKEGDVVERDEMVKGYEFAKGEYVTFTEPELKAID